MRKWLGLVSYCLLAGSSSLYASTGQDVTSETHLETYINCPDFSGQWTGPCSKTDADGSKRVETFHLTVDQQDCDSLKFTVSTPDTSSVDHVRPGYLFDTKRKATLGTHNSSQLVSWREGKRLVSRFSEYYLYTYSFETQSVETSFAMDGDTLTVLSENFYSNPKDGQVSRETSACTFSKVQVD